MAIKPVKPKTSHPSLHHQRKSELRPPLLRTAGVWVSPQGKIAKGTIDNYVELVLAGLERDGYPMHIRSGWRISDRPICKHVQSHLPLPRERCPDRSGKSHSGSGSRCRRRPLKNPQTGWTLPKTFNRFPQSGTGQIHRAI